MEKEKILFFERLVEESKNSPDKKKIALGLIKKALEKQPFDKDLHKLYLSCISDDKESILKFINDLLSVFSLTLDYKYYDLILMIIANDIYKQNEDEIYPLINDLHDIIRNFHVEKKEELNEQINDLETENLVIGKELSKKLLENDDLVKELDILKKSQEKLQYKIDNLNHMRSNIEKELDTRKKVLRELEEEKSNLIEKNKNIIEQLDDIEDELKTLSHDNQELASEKEKLLDTNNMLKERIDSISEVVAKVVVRQDNQYDRIEGKIKNLEKIKDKLASYEKETVSDNTEDTSEDLIGHIVISGKDEDKIEEIEIKDESLSNRVYNYILALEKLVQKTNSDAEIYKDENQKLHERIAEIQEQLDNEYKTLEDEKIEEIREEMYKDAYDKAYQDAYKKAYEEASEKMEKSIQEITDDFKKLNTISESLEDSMEGEKDDIGLGIEELKQELSSLNQEVESKDDLIKSYKEAIYEIFDENHELLKSLDNSETLISSYENGLMNFLKRKGFIKLNGNSKSKKRTTTGNTSKKKNNTVNKSKSKSKKSKSSSSSSKRGRKKNSSDKS